MLAVLNARKHIYIGEDLGAHVFTQIQGINVPYGVKVHLVVGDIYLYSAKYYSLSSVDIVSVEYPRSSTEQLRTLDTIVYELYRVEFIGDKLDPSNVTTTGGNCQAVAITIRVNLERNGITSGYVEFPEHLANWALIEDTYYLIDLFNEEVREMKEDEIIEYTR